MDMQRLAEDSSASAEDYLVERWRAMPAADKLAMAMAMSQTARELAIAGVQQRHPDAGPREQFLRLALVTLGPTLARAAYPEIATLDRP